MDNSEPKSTPMCIVISIAMMLGILVGWLIPDQKSARLKDELRRERIIHQERVKTLRRHLKYPVIRRPGGGNGA